MEAGCAPKQAFVLVSAAGPRGEWTWDTRFLTLPPGRGSRTLMVVSCPSAIDPLRASTFALRASGWNRLGHKSRNDTELLLMRTVPDRRVVERGVSAETVERGDCYIVGDLVRSSTRCQSSLGKRSDRQRGFEEPTCGWPSSLRLLLSWLLQPDSSASRHGKARPMPSSCCPPRARLRQYICRQGGPF